MQTTIEAALVQHVWNVTQSIHQTACYTEVALNYKTGTISVWSFLLHLSCTFYLFGDEVFLFGRIVANAEHDYNLDIHETLHDGGPNTPTS